MHSRSLHEQVVLITHTLVQTASQSYVVGSSSWVNMKCLRSGVKKFEVFILLMGHTGLARDVIRIEKFS